MRRRSRRRRVAQGGAAGLMPQLPGRGPAHRGRCGPRRCPPRRRCRRYRVARPYTPGRLQRHPRAGQQEFVWQLGCPCRGLAAPGGQGDGWSAPERMTQGRATGAGAAPIWRARAAHLGQLRGFRLDGVRDYDVGRDTRACPRQQPQALLVVATRRRAWSAKLRRRVWWFQTRRCAVPPGRLGRAMR